MVTVTDFWCHSSRWHRCFATTMLYFPLHYQVTILGRSLGKALTVQGIGSKLHDRRATMNLVDIDHQHQSVLPQPQLRHFSWKTLNFDKRGLCSLLIFFYIPNWTCGYIKDQLFMRTLNQSQLSPQPEVQLDWKLLSNVQGFFPLCVVDVVVVISPSHVRSYYAPKRLHRPKSSKCNVD